VARSVESTPWRWSAHADELGERPVVVVYGGTSTEREVSLASGAAVLAAFAAPGDGPTARLCPEVSRVEIQADGRWDTGSGPSSPAAALETLPPDAMYFLALHGGSGEDGRIAAFLEIAGRLHTGTGHASAALCMHKGRTRLAAAEVGVRVAPGFSISRHALQGELTAYVRLARALPGEVCFVKHATGGSSVHVFRCSTDEEIESALTVLRDTGGDAVVEGGIVGLEVSAGVMGNGRDAIALPVIEILPKGSKFFDYHEKYAADGAFERCPAERLGEVNERAVQAAARATWDAVGGEGYGRVDFIVPGPAAGSCDDEATPVLLEVNTLPGLTPRSLLPREAAVAGLDFRALCFEILARGLDRRALLGS